MKLLNKAGFTIIETMLFLGITGLLVAGLLVGTGTSISIQRYRDSVKELQSTLQQQYSDVSNVSNDNSGDLTCYGDGSISPKGQSNCVILGKFITATNSHSLSVKTVIGRIPLKSVSSLSDEAIFSEEGYNINISTMASSTYDIEWGASIVDKKGIDTSFSMLILRSPSSGVIRTFVDPSRTIADKDIKNLLNTSPSALTQSANLCIDSNGLFTGTRNAIFITANSTGPNGVEVRGDASSGC